MVYCVGLYFIIASVIGKFGFHLERFFRFWIVDLDSFFFIRQSSFIRWPPGFNILIVRKFILCDNKH